jgi:hypothetical protein
MLDVCSRAMRALLAGLVLTLACTPTPGPSGPSGPTSMQKPVGCNSPEPGQAMTREQCECRGATINLSRGGEQRDHCPAGAAELGTVRLGIEGGWCCKAP